MKKDNQALIVVDYQNGFIPEKEGGTGELGVVGGGLLAPRINELMTETKRKGGLVIATRDWHPRGHMSFASNYKDKKAFETITLEEIRGWIKQEHHFSDTAEFTLADLNQELMRTREQMLWPDHCIAGTKSAEYHSGLDTSLIDHHIIKGYDPTTEMYSGFAGREDTPERKSLTQILQEFGIQSIRTVGLATDYCVQSTAVDSIKNGFKSLIDSSVIAGVAVQSPEDTIKYLAELREKTGIDFV